MERRNFRGSLRSFGGGVDEGRTSSGGRSLERAIARKDGQWEQWEQRIHWSLFAVLYCFWRHESMAKLAEPPPTSGLTSVPVHRTALSAEAWEGHRHVNRVHPQASTKWAQGGQTAN